MNHSTSSSALISAAACGAALLGVVACGGTPACMEGVRLGTEYQVTVLEPYDKNSKFSFDENFSISERNRCGEFDLKAASFRVTPTKDLSNVGCHGRAASVSGVPDLQIVATVQDVQDAFRGLMSSPIQSALYKGDCRLAWSAEFDGPDRKANPLSAPIPGKLPPLTMFRRFEPDPLTIDACRAAGFPADKTACGDYFVVQLSEPQK